MLKKHLISLITNSHDYKPTQNQGELINVLADFVINKEKNKIIVVKGYAGTGKTTTISALVKTFRELKIKSVLLAPTGRAAKVLTSYSGKIAYTIHKKIYRQKSSKDGFGRFALEKNLHTNTFFLVDEASMISNTAGDSVTFGSGRLLDDLIKYVYSGPGCRLILIGDTAQLPPVGISISPALDAQKLAAYGIETEYIELTEVIRQSQSSGILITATQIRKNITNLVTDSPKFNISGFNDVFSISGNELVEEISSSYSNHGINDTVIICRSNKRANKFNQGIRNQIFNYEKEIVPGELLMVVKNNYYWISGDERIDFIANGDIIEILKIKKYYELYGFRFAEVIIRMADYNIEVDANIMLDTLSIDTPSLSEEENKKLLNAVMEDYADLKSREQQYDKARNNEYYNALQVKYAYAVTCHKAQGGQWNTVFIDQGYITDDMINIDYLRWLYTAFTRAVKTLFLVNFPDIYFE